MTTQQQARAHGREAPAWPASAIPANGRIAPWLRTALTKASAVPRHKRSAVYKGRVLLAKALAVAGDDVEAARAMAGMGAKKLEDLITLANDDPGAARETAKRHGRGEIPYGGVRAIARSKAPTEAIATTIVPAWPLPVRPGASVDMSTRWDVLTALRDASGLKGVAFARLHGIPDLHLRKAAMVMGAARRLADGRPHRALKIAQMRPAAIVKSDKSRTENPVAYATLLAWLDQAARPENSPNG